MPSNQDVCTAPPMAGSPNNIVGNITFHHLMYLMSIIAIIITGVTNSFLVLSHLWHAVNRREQSLILRIIAVPPAFALAGMFAVTYYPAAPYLVKIPTIWESIGVASLFELFVLYLVPEDIESKRRAYFDGLERIGRFDKQRVHNYGSYRWYKVIRLCVYQFPVFSVLVVIITDAAAPFQCPNGNPAKAVKAICAVISIISTLIAVLAIIRFYLRLRPELRKFGAVSKLFGLKSIVGITTLQLFVITIIENQPSIEYGTSTISGGDIAYGIPNWLTCLEMMVFTTLYFFAFTSKPYKQQEGKTGPDGKPIRAGNFKIAAQLSFDSVNIWDIFVGIGEGALALIELPKGREFFYSKYGKPNFEMAVPSKQISNGSSERFPPTQGRPELERQTTPGSFV